MRNLIIDERIRKIEYEYLSKYFNVIKLPLSKDVYEEISGHSDIFYCKINDKIICAPNAKIKEKHFEIGKTKVEKVYPFDIPYNVCQIGNKVIGSKHTDKSINIDLMVKQGYTKCSIAVTSDKSCITTDKTISQKLIKIGIDALFIDEDNINLLDCNCNISNKKGFIGGATLVFDNKFVLFGDINRIKNRDKILEHLVKYNLEIIDFKGLNINDYGSGVYY
ncbi:MAG: DUF6873 family GME fold protein [Candidatus Scatovivens sp.]